MFCYDFQCQRCGWDMERLVSRYVIEVKCPMCGYMSQNRRQHPKRIIDKTHMCRIPVIFQVPDNLVFVGVIKELEMMTVLLQILSKFLINIHNALFQAPAISDLGLLFQ